MTKRKAHRAWVRRKRRRPAHPVVWVYQDWYTGRWRYAPPLCYRPRRNAARDLGEALALVVVSGVLLYVAFSGTR